MNNIRIFTSITGQMVMGEDNKTGGLRNPMAVILKPSGEGRMGVAVMPLNPFTTQHGIKGSVDDLYNLDNLLECHNIPSDIKKDIEAMYTKHLTGIDIVSPDKNPQGLKLV